MPYTDPEKYKAYHKEYYRVNKKKLNAKNSEYYYNNLEKCKELMAKRRQAKPEEYRNRMLLRIGWSQDKYNEAFVEQKGKCAICGAPPEECRYGVLAADHEHVQPPKSRGLLCTMCNVGLGAFKDNPTVLANAIQYLRKNSSDAA